MKKFLTLFLAMTMILSLVACGGSKKEEPKQEETKTEETKAPRMSWDEIKADPEYSKRYDEEMQNAVKTRLKSSKGAEEALAKFDPAKELLARKYNLDPESPDFYDSLTKAINEYGHKAKILKELEGKKVTIQRSKGLGENDPEMMWMTTMNPETRRLIKVMPEDAERTAHYFDVLLGDALNERKNFIAENGSKYLEMADIS